MAGETPMVDGGGRVLPATEAVIDTRAAARRDYEEEAGLPHFTVAVTPPDLSPWLEGNTGVPGFTSFAAPRSGPHVVLLALMHGNEICGAVVLDQLLREGVRPACGRLTIGFANFAAYRQFDAANPIASRFVDEDMNRVWDPAMLDGPRRSAELDRAREIRAVIDTADLVLDLHSMLWPSEPLILCGQGPASKALARALGTPELVVADSGHAGGRRLIDYPRFAAARDGTAAVLVEAGQHWQAATAVQMRRSVDALLAQAGMAGAAPPRGAARFAEVTRVITASTGRFAFVRAFQGGEVIRERDTLLAHDGMTEIRTPYDDCLLVMPSYRTGRGHTAVRLARFVE